MMIVPIDVTVVGIVTDVTFVHDWKAEPAIKRVRVSINTVTDSGV